MSTALDWHRSLDEDHPDAIIDQASLEADMRSSGLGSHLKRLKRLRESDQASRVGAARSLLQDRLSRFIIVVTELIEVNRP